MTMNCEETERDLLLAESGELAPDEARAVAAHIAACESCRCYRDDMRRLVVAIPAALGEASPRPTVMQAILSAAARRPVHLRLTFARAVVNPLAWAAALALAATGWWLLTPRHNTDRIHNTTAIVAVLSEREVPAAVNPAAGGADHDLRRLADALLMLEGLTADEPLDGDAPYDEISLPGEPSPTVLQPHSSGVPLARRCV